MSDDYSEFEALFAQGVKMPSPKLVPLPSMPIPLPFFQQRSTAQAVESGSVKQVATGELPHIPPSIDELRVGDEITLPDGSTEAITWIDPKKKRIAVGKKKSRRFFSLTTVTRVSGASVARKLNDALIEERKKRKKLKGRKEPLEMPTEIAIPDGVKLYPHQIENIAFLRKYGKGIIADEMGLGKTATAIVALQKPSVVVCPALLKVNWSREIARWRPDLSTTVVSGSPSKISRAARSADVVIINYDILHTHAKWITERGNKTVVADEAQYLKNLRIKFNRRNKSFDPRDDSPRRAKAFYEIWRGTPHVLLLTGTPIMNRTKELFPLLHLIDPYVWGNYLKFAVRYCGAYSVAVSRYKTVLDDTGCTNAAELHERISGKFMMRHTKEGELKNLPPKSRSSLSVSLDKKSAEKYRAAARDFLRWLANTSSDPEAATKAEAAKALTKLTALRGIVASGKAPATINYIVEHFASTERPLVVMGVHREAFDLIEDGIIRANREYEEQKKLGELPPIPHPIRYDKVLGGISASRRQKAVDDFQSGKLDVILYSIPIATGTTLTRAQDMVFFERMWRPSDQLQAEDRCHRIGQENHVSIVYLDAAGTVDGKMAMLLQDKAETAAAVIDGVELTEEEASMLVRGEMVERESIAELVAYLRETVRRNRGGGSAGRPVPYPLLDNEGDIFDGFESAEDDAEDEWMELLNDSWADPI